MLSLRSSCEFCAFGLLILSDSHLVHSTHISSLCRIEHVFPDVIEEIPFVIFKQIHPKLVCVTTPNCEFNQLFGLADGKFRHWDHKFEWTRAQFQDWAENICARFPEYAVIFTGIGKPPSKHAQLGCVSQMAVFVRNDVLIDGPEMAESTDKSNDVEMKESPGYEIVHTVTYPFFKDLRTRNEKLIDEIDYLIRQYRYYSEYMNDDANRIEIPLDHIVGSCYKYSEDAEEIKQAIEAQGFVVEDINVILSNPNDDQDESDYNEDEDSTNVI
jgi:hypothetical protein